MNSFWRHTAAVVLLCCLGLVAYGGTLKAGFVWDDLTQVIRNPFLEEHQPWLPLVTGDVWSFAQGGRITSNYYRPLQLLTYRATRSAAGLNAAAFHGVNLACNLLATVMAYAVFWRLTRRHGVALAAAVVYAVHPEHSEAVAWIAALPDLGCGLFLFLSFFLFLGAWQDAAPAGARAAGRQQRRRPAATEHAGRRRGLLAGSLLAFALALLWKEMAMTLPLLVAAYALLFSGQASWKLRSREALQRSLPYWAVLAGYVVFRIRMLGFFSRVQQDWPMTGWQQGMSAIELVGKYWLKLVLPLGLNAYHQFVPPAPLLRPQAIAAGVFLAAAAGALIYAMRRLPGGDGKSAATLRLGCFAALWVFLTLAPVLNPRSLGDNPFAERYLYIPSLGFSLLMAVLGAEGLRRMPARAARWGGVAALAVAASLAIGQTRHRVAEWRDEVALFSSSVKESPRSARVHEMLALALQRDRGDIAGAEREYRIAVEAARANPGPDDTQLAAAYVGLARIAMSRQQFEAALAELDRALATGVVRPGIVSTRGAVLIELGRLDEAQAQLEQARQRYPFDEGTLQGLGMLAIRRNDCPRAIELLQQAIVVDETVAANFNNLAYCYGQAGDWQKAAGALRRAVVIEPGNAEYHSNLGIALARIDRYDEARAEFLAAVKIDPTRSEAVENLRRLGINLRR